MIFVLIALDKEYDLLSVTLYKSYQEALNDVQKLVNEN